LIDEVANVRAPRELLADPNTQALDFLVPGQDWSQSVIIDAIVLCLLFALKGLIVIRYSSNYTSSAETYLYTCFKARERDVMWA
jgi:hypothetical protein